MPSGYGSVYRLSGNRRRPWIARKTIGWDGESGKQLYYTIGYYATKKEALAALAEYNRNPIGLTRDITLGELYKKWSDSRFPKMKYATLKTYTSAWVHLSALGDMKVRDIKTSHFQDVVDNLVKKGLSYSTCHKVKVLAGLLCKYALADDIVTKNYAEGIVLPPKPEPKQEFFAQTEIHAIDKLAKHNEWAKAVMIMIYTGFRIGELLALTKFSVNWDEKTITGGGKTEAGTDRKIPIHKRIEEYVRYWYNTPGEYLINREGQKIGQKYFREHLYKPVLQEAQVRVLTPHATRHTFSTMLAKANVHPKVMQELMGHADPSTTLGIYTHSDVAMLQEAMAQIR